jgi:hypothetical protein
MSRLDRDIWPDNWKERLVMVATIVLFLGILYLWLTNPAWIFRIDAILGQQGPQVVDTGGSLEINAEDVQYMNRIYRERTAEIAYCGLVVDGNRIQPWLADVVNDSRFHVEVTTEDCPTEPGNLEATIHTHPPAASGELSARDRQTFFERRWTYMCVQHGPIEDDIGMQPTELTCHEKVTAGAKPEIRRIAVQVVG